MVSLANRDVDKVTDEVNSLLEPLGYILLVDPEKPTQFFIKVVAQKGKEEDVKAILEWIGSLIANPAQTLQDTIWNGKQVVEE